VIYSHSGNAFLVTKA